MYTVLVVDDEDPVLDSYSHMIRTEELGVTVCGTARSGSEALSVAHQTRPDIVIMDIAMPGIDGLDTIKELQKAFPETLYVLSTAYERFDIAQRAIPLGVFAYLVKPVSRKRFVETVRQAVRHLDERAAELSHRIEAVQSTAEALAREQQNFLLLASWKPLDAEQWSRYRRLFRLDADLCSVLVVSCDRLPADRSRADLHAEMIRRFERRYRCLWTDYLGRLLVLVSDSAPAESVAKHMRAIVEELRPAGVHVRLGVGARRPYQQLYLSFEQAIAGCADSDEQTRVLLAQEQALREIRRAVAAARTLQEVYPRCAAYWETELTLFPFPVFKARMVAFFTLVLDDFVQRTGCRETPAAIGDPAREISAIETRQGWEAWAGRALRLLTERGNAAVPIALPAPLQRAVRNINANYAQPLHLSQLAELCEVSAGYLSRLFSEHLNTTFIDYLNTVRLNVAEERLIENRMPIKEIAYSVGYQDPNYFSRIFKKHKGLSPTSYLTRKDTHEH